jgi:hypothetical protein
MKTTIRTPILFATKTSINKKQYSYDTYMHQRNSETKAIA